MKTSIQAALLAVAASVAMVACGGGGGGDVAPAPDPSSGTLRVALTDAPACGFDQVVVTVEKVRVHQSSGAGENDAGWHDMAVNPPQRIDLLSLQNGLLVDLGQTSLPAGQYTQMRLVLSSNGSGNPANFVMPNGSGMMPVGMDTPSAQQSGIKLIHGFTIEAGKTTGLVLDFDACRSIVQRGNGSYGLKPVIGVMPMTLTAIAGYVETGMTGVSVTAQRNGEVVKATQPMANGYFNLAPLDPAKGPYDVVFTGAGKTTSVITGVPVTAEQTTTINASASAVAVPAAATSSLVSGRVDPAGARPTAWVRALQTVSAARVEVAYTNVAGDGTYSRSLPTVAPRYVAYSVPFVTAPSFATDSANAGKYDLQASASGYQMQQKTLPTLTGAALPDQVFTLTVAP
jgi:hypothetical protein